MKNNLSKVRSGQIWIRDLRFSQLHCIEEFLLCTCRFLILFNFSYVIGRCIKVLLNHISASSMDNSHVCQECQETFNEPALKRLHMFQKHNIKEERSKVDHDGRSVVKSLSRRIFCCHLSRSLERLCYKRFYDYCCDPGPG